MKKKSTWTWGIVPLAAGAFAVSAAAAKTPTPHHRVSCAAIASALASGKSAAEVAKELKTSPGRIHRCTAATAKRERGHRSTQAAPHQGPKTPNGTEPAAPEGKAM